MRRFDIEGGSWVNGYLTEESDDGTLLYFADVEPIIAERDQLRTERDAQWSKLVAAEVHLADERARNKRLCDVIAKLLTALEDKRNRGFYGATMLFYAPSKSGHETCKNIAEWLRGELRERTS
jgi:hypothetical protein